MFATLTGPLPDRPDLLELQIEAGIGLLTDGVAHRPAEDVATDGPVRSWRALAARAAGHPVKALLAGPGHHPTAAAPDLPALAAAILALADAGAPVVELAEPTLPPGDDPAALAALLDAHRRLADLLPPDLVTHLALSLGAGAERLGDGLLDLPYRSVGFDLIGGPDDWRIAVRLPGDRGLVAGALDPGTAGAGDLETAVWAARYAASSGGRGLERVGLTNAPGLHAIPADAFERKLLLLGEAARLATAPRTELERILDPRAIGPF